jgi:outer membrane protein assembly factor BamB
MPSGTIGSRFYLACCFIVALSFGAQAQVSDRELEDLGMESAWQAQAAVLPFGAGIVSADVWIDESNVQKYAVVDLPTNSVISVSAGKLDSKNQPIGMEQAKAEALARAAKVLGQSTGIEVAEVTLPKLRLVITTASGLIQNYDAETGKLIWATPCGSTSLTALPAAVSNEGVIVVQGDMMYILDWATGRQLMTKHLTTSTACALTAVDGVIPAPTGVQRPDRINTLALVADFSGLLKSVELLHKSLPWQTRLIGRATTRPVTSADRRKVAVGTNTGMVYLLEATGQPRVTFRYESRAVLSSLSAGAQAFYAGFDDGTLAKLTTDGKIGWRFNLSHPISERALVDRDNGLVFVASESGEFTAIDDSTGIEAWPQSVHSSIRGAIGVTADNVICRTTDDSLVAIDKKTGQIRGKTSSKPLQYAMQLNGLTDRIYLVGNHGQLQCLRPLGKVIPKVYQAIAAPEKKTPSDENADVPLQNNSGDTLDGADPFGTTTDDTSSGSIGADSTDPFGDK